MYVNDRDIKTFDLCIFERSTIPTPERDVEFIEVKGRDGSLTRKHGFKDMVITVELNIMLEKNVKTKIREIKAFLINAETITFKDDRDVFYKVKNTHIEDVENEIKEYGKFQILFVVEPYSYFVSGEQWIELKSGDSLQNTTMYNAKPLLEVTFNGTTADNYVQINNAKLSQIVGKTATYIIDSGAEVIYTEFGNAMGDFNFERLPELVPGENKISGTFSKLRLKSRWRTV